MYVEKFGEITLLFIMRFCRSMSWNGLCVACCIFCTAWNTSFNI